MSALSPAWHVKKSTNKYAVNTRNSSEIIYRANNYSESTVFFDASKDDDLLDIFSGEDVVEVYIGDPDTDGVKMFTGIIDEINTERAPGRQRLIKLHIVDWGGYLSAKRIFVKKYFRSRTVNNILSDTLSSVTDGISILTGANIEPSTSELKQFFEGTYVKDIWHKCAEVGKLDYFVDENKDLNAFETSTKLLQLAGITYKIQDMQPDAAHKIVVRFTKPYNFMLDSSQKYRNVKVTNGIIEYHPKELDLFQTASFHHDILGKKFSQYYTLGLPDDYSVDVVGTGLNPVQFVSDELLDPNTPTITRPIARFVVIGPAQAVGIGIQPLNNLIPAPGFGIEVDQWEEISFWMKNNLTRQTGSITNFTLFIREDGLNFWSLPMVDFLSPDWKYHRLKLPTTTDNSEPYTGGTWSKTGNPAKFNFGALNPTPATGYDAFSTISFSQFFLYRSLFATVLAAGNPPTQKIIVDKSLNNFNQLLEFATNEHARTNQETKKANCTINGNTAFRKPAYAVDVDFTATLGAGRSGTLRMDNIRHFLEGGIHLTDLVFNNSFHRP